MSIFSFLYVCFWNFPVQWNCWRTLIHCQHCTNGRMMHYVPSSVFLYCAEWERGCAGNNCQEDIGCWEISSLSSLLPYRALQWYPSQLIVGREGKCSEGGILIIKDYHKVLISKWLWGNIICLFSKCTLWYRHVHGAVLASFCFVGSVLQDLSIFACFPTFVQDMILLDLPVALDRNQS